MKIYNERKDYLIKELAIITGLDQSMLHKLNIPKMVESKSTYSKKPVKSIGIKDFEKFLHTKRMYNFKIEAYKKFKVKKRPIIREFLSIKETVKFMESHGLKENPRTLHYKIKHNEFIAYRFDRKYIVPITYLCSLFSIDRHDSQLQQLIHNIIQL